MITAAPVRFLSLNSAALIVERRVDNVHRLLFVKPSLFGRTRHNDIRRSWLYGASRTTYAGGIWHGVALGPRRSGAPLFRLRFTDQMETDQTCTPFRSNRATRSVAVKAGELKKI